MGEFQALDRAPRFADPNQGERLAETRGCPPRLSIEYGAVRLRRGLEFPEAPERVRPVEVRIDQPGIRIGRTRVVADRQPIFPTTRGENP